jgi:deoxyribodipyrimidine photo-lyase
MELFPPTRDAGLSRLAEFAPRAGRAYAATRNIDPGPDERPGVSELSPYVRRRLLLEQELVEAALGRHGRSGAEKFVQEVFWRTYWKGWLEARPSVWLGYREAVRRAHDRLATEAGLRRVFHDAAEGRTGIACFDAWAHELVERNWLHNHTRMWFASIWIFTLRLPWELGADLFMRHLLDGDPASNTLSWRWVAGLHTPGKNYLARAENIQRCTDGRFNPAGELDEHAAPLTEDPSPPPPAPPPPDPPPSGEATLLLHEDDCMAESLPLDGVQVRAIGVLPPTGAQAHLGAAEPVRAFASAALADAAARTAARFGVEPTFLCEGDVAAWAEGRQLVAAWAPVGPAGDQLSPLPVRRVRRAWDERTWPHATRGFFKVKDAIPRILAGLM